MAAIHAPQITTGSPDNLTGITLPSVAFTKGKPQGYAVAVGINKMTGTEAFAQFAPPENQ